jgi:hypothetical protein
MENSLAEPDLSEKVEDAVKCYKQFARKLVTFTTGEKGQNPV